MTAPTDDSDSDSTGITGLGVILGSTDPHP